MALTRRNFIQAIGAATLVGCAADEVTAGEDADVLGPDVKPDETLDAELIAPDASPKPEDASPQDSAADAATMDASRDPGDAPSSDGAVRDSATRDSDSPDVGPRDAGVRDAGSDAGPPPASLDFRGLPELTARFPVGVMAGDADASSVMFWTRYEGTATVTLRVLEMAGSAITAVRFNGPVTPSSAGYVRSVVTGLRPGRQHLYAFLLGPERSPTGRSAVGRVQTALADDALSPIVFGGTSCTNQNHRPFPSLVHAGGRNDLDFFIHAGDHVYTDHGTAAVTLGQYREKYEENWSSAGLKALHRSTGMYLTWDDHEVHNNWDPEHTTAARLAAARQAFFEYRATRRNSAVPDRIWRSFRWGRTAEIFVLDCRSERLPSTRSADPSRPSQYISRAQMNWLKSGLSDSRAVFKFIVNSVPIVDRAGADTDNWNGYASQRRELLNHIVNNRLRGVVFLSGDVHFGGVCQVEDTGPWSDVWEVIMGPSGATRDGPPSLRATQFPVRVVGEMNYTLLRADPSTRRLSVEFINNAGGTIPDSRWTHTF